LPALSTGMAVPVTRLQTKRSYTKPPPRFNASSLLQRMEQESIGTKATRTAIIDTLSRRGYIVGSSIRITDLGYSIVETLEMYCPGIMSVEMTRGLEEKLERIQTGGEDAEQVVGGAKADLGPILERFKANEALIGEAISGTLNEVAREENYLGPCPTCGKGDILLKRSPGAVYASCSNPDCKQSYGLPQKKRIYPTGNRCPACGAPIVKMYFNRRPWTLCINAGCPTKGEAKYDQVQGM
jgi:DNA topoisomerase-1